MALPLQPLIQPATAPDLARLAYIEAQAFAEGPLSGLIFGLPSDESVKQRTEALEKELESAATTMRLEKAEVEGEIVGFALWHLYRDPRPLENWQDKEEWPGMLTKDGANEFFGTMSRLRDRYVNGKSYAYLHILVVLPEFHGRGVGSALIKNGLAMAAEASLPIWLASSEMGYRVYKKFGFEDVDEFYIDVSKYGGKGKTKTVCMLKPVGTKLVVEEA